MPAELRLSQQLDLKSTDDLTPPLDIDAACSDAMRGDFTAIANLGFTRAIFDPSTSAVIIIQPGLTIATHVPLVCAICDGLSLSICSSPDTLVAHLEDYPVVAEIAQTGRHPVDLSVRRHYVSTQHEQPVSIGNSGFIMFVDSQNRMRTNKRRKTRHDFLPDGLSQAAGTKYGCVIEPCIPKHLVPFLQKIQAYNMYAIEYLRTRNRLLYEASLHALFTDPFIQAVLLDCIGSPYPILFNDTNYAMYRYRQRLFAETSAFSCVEKGFDGDCEHPTWSYQLDLEQAVHNRNLRDHLTQSSRILQEGSFFMTTQ